MASRQMLERLKSAKVNGGGNNAKAANNGEVIIKEVKFPTLPGGGDTFIAELFVVSSEDQPGATDWDGKPEYANKPGTSFGFIQKPNDPNKKNAPGDIRAFIEAVAGAPFEQDDEYLAALEAATNEDPKAKDGAGNLIGANPLRGYRLRYSTFPKTIKNGANKGKVIHVPKWTHVEQREADVAASIELIKGK